MKYALLPFINALVLYIFVQEGQLLNKPYEWFKNNILPRIPISHKVLGGCILCTGFWMGFIEMLFVRNDILVLFILAYNACAVSIIYKNL